MFAEDLPPLLSPDWYRLSNVKPRMRAGVRVSRQLQRGQIWFLLTDPVSGRHHRFNELAYSLIGACDGQASIDAIWAERTAQLGDDAPTQGETIRVFAQAFAANLFAGDVPPDVAAITRSQVRGQRARRRGQINPLAFRVRLFNPNALLERQLRRVQWVFKRATAWALAALLLLGTLLLLVTLGDVTQHAHQTLGSGRVLLCLWLAYPVMKLLHEGAHAVAVKRYGGQVTEMGVTLMMLTPVPYVDASASIAFASKHQRMAVAGAGILVEMVCASLALPLFLLAEVGLLKDLAFAVVFIGALSTLAINGNPLLRFDGYHVLCDAAELPNLAQRSQRWWHTVVKQRLLRLPHVRFGALAAGEAKWLWAYAPLASAYRLVMMVLLVAAVTLWHPNLGLAMLALVLWQGLMRPAWNLWRWLRHAPELRGHRPRAWVTLGSATAAMLLTALLLPLPHHTHATGLVWLPDDALARASTEGFVDAVLADEGQPVLVGTPLVRLVNDQLLLDLAQAEAELQRQQVERAGQFGTSARRTADADEALVRLSTARDRLALQVQGLTVRAAAPGRLALDLSKLRRGQMVAQGAVLGHVLSDGPALVRALVNHQDVALVHERAQDIQVWLPGLGSAQAAALTGQTPRASTALPSRALGQSAGGVVAQDSADRSGKTAQEALFQVDLRLATNTPAPIGSRVLVRFAHGEATAAKLGWRSLRQTFLRHFET
jgi:putative peptide zinc metalloprotease protein